MRAELRVASIAVVLASFPGESVAGETIALDSYTCAQFLSDTTEPANGTKLLKTLMMISWATGYAAAHQKDTPRADATAVQLIAATLGDACRRAPASLVVRTITEKIAEFSKPTAIQPSSTQGAGVVDGSTFITYPNFDLYGGDSRKVERIEALACVATCQEDPSCQAYSYDRWTKACYLKSTVVVLNLDPTSTSGVRSGLPPASLSTSPVRINRLVSKAFNGTSRSIRAASREACEQNCQQDRSCLGYTFSRNNKTCNVFDSIDTHQPNTSATSGLKTQNPP